MALALAAVVFTSIVFAAFEMNTTEGVLTVLLPVVTFVLLKDGRWRDWVSVTRSGRRGGERLGSG
jgi:hypothetical protein